MGRGILAVATAVIAAAAMTGSLLAQSASFGDIAGKWEGIGAGGTRLDMDIDAAGKYSVSSARGSESGTAKMEGGQAVLSFTKNPGNIKVAKKGETLAGTLTLGANTNPITFNRKK